MSSRLSRFLNGKAALSAAGLLVVGGVAAGAVEGLPGPAEEADDRADEAVSSDVELPDEADGAPERPDAANRGERAGTANAGELPLEANGGGVEASSQGRDGQQVSSDVHEAIDRTEPGLERGQAVSDVASDGRSGAGDAVGGEATADASSSGDDGASNAENGQPASDHAGQAPEDHPGQDAAEAGQGNRPGS